jgi:hypothetical protein
MSVRLKRDAVENGCVFSWTDGLGITPKITFFYEENRYIIGWGNQFNEYKTYSTARAVLAQHLKGRF